jgi:NAD(P)-dependent dehydrogenase (short-subunit alcohol dehydrogenase family)
MALANPPPLGTQFLPKDTFAGQTVIVTGGGTGLGKGIAVEFARAGANIGILSRKPEHLEQGIKAIEEVGGKVCAASADIRDPEQIAAAFDKIEAELGPVSILVNNAAGNFPSPAERISPNGWRTITDIVLNGTFFCSREFALRRLKAKAGGSILNIGATYAWTGGPATAPSAAAKAGVSNMTQSLAVEWAPDNIRVNCIAPGRFVHDDFPAEMLIGEDTANAANNVPAQRTGLIHELGWAATFLCSPFAAYITGHTLVVDGANWLRRSAYMPEFTPVRDMFDQWTAKK